MNIGDIPPPDIKPTKLPSIVVKNPGGDLKLPKDRGSKTLRTEGASHTPNQPIEHKGQVNEILKQLFASDTKTKTSGDFGHSRDVWAKKKGGNGWIVGLIWVGLIFGGNIIGFITENFDEATQEDISSLFEGSTQDTDTEPEPIAQTGATTYETDCYTIQIPDAVGSVLENSVDTCSIFFIGGEFTAVSPPLNLDGTPYYEDEDTYQSLVELAPGYTTIDDRPAIKEDAPDGSGGIRYTVWAGDLGRFDRNGESIQFVQFTFWPNEKIDEEQIEQVMDSLEFKAAFSPES